MKIKNIVCIILCLCLLLCATACRNNGDILSSNYSTNDFNSQIITSNTEDDNNSINNSQNSNLLSSTDTSSSDDASDLSKPEESIDVEEVYGFSSLKTIEIKCLQDSPYGDTEYEVITVKTNKNKNVSYMCDISCNSGEVKITDQKILVPYDFKKKNDSITITATHRPTGIKCDLKITLDKWELVFEDEFNGTKLNTDIWNVWNSADWQYFYSPDSVTLDGNGHLISRAYILEEPDSKFGYTMQSSAITTKDKYESTYGYYEISMKPHNTSGVRSSFWLMAGDMGDKDAIADGSAVNGAEFDILETLFNSKIPSHAIHWDGYYNDQTQSYGGFAHEFKPRPEIFDGKFHTFAMSWTMSGYSFFVDGELTEQVDYMGICNQPAYMLISSHFSDWDGDVTMKPGEYNDMIVDYVRIYQISPNS